MGRLDTSYTPPKEAPRKDTQTVGTAAQPAPKPVPPITDYASI